MIAKSEDLKRALRRMLNDGETVITSYQLARCAHPDARRNNKGPIAPNGMAVSRAGCFLIDIYKYGLDGYMIAELPGKYITLRMVKNEP